MGQLQFQQGDINITYIAKPEKVKPIKAKPIRLGESTGHSHRIVGSEWSLFEPDDWQNKRAGVILAEIKSPDCQLVHEEHKTIDLPVGFVEFRPTVEYDHFANRSAYIRD